MNFYMKSRFDIMRDIWAILVIYYAGARLTGHCAERNTLPVLRPLSKTLLRRSHRYRFQNIAVVRCCALLCAGFSRTLHRVSYFVYF